MLTKSPRLLISFVLAAPLLLFSFHQYIAHQPGLIPTGFIQADDVVYMANARQHVEGKPGLAYSNPFSSSASSPKIYSQPYNYLLALFLLLDGTSPGWVLLVFGLVCAVGCIYVLLKLVDYLYPNLDHKNLVYLVMIWGGGLTAVAGLVANVSFLKGTYSDFWSGIYMVDPGNGWWGMNFGRILVISTEAYYHLLFIAGIYLIIRHKWLLSFLASFILAWSHPFSGVEYLLIVCGWLFVEKVFIRNKSIPLFVFISYVFLLLLHLFYYIYFLNSFPEHKKLFETFSVDWGYSFRVYIPAYSLVFLLAAYVAFKLKATVAFGSAHQRLFFLWALIAFLLSNHEWFMKPIQPIHFARGYVWLGLFLFGIPGLVDLMQKFRKTRIVVGLFILIFLLDNLLWYSIGMRSTARNESVSYITQETKDVLEWLRKNTSTNDLLLSNEQLVTYMANAYASSYSLVGHIYNTPDFQTKQQQQQEFLRTGIIRQEWKGRRLLIICNKSTSNMLITEELKKNKLFENHGYQIFTP